MENRTQSSASPPTFHVTVVTAAVIVAGLWFGRGLLIPLAVTALLFILWAALVDRLMTMSVVGRSPPGWLSQIIGACLVLAAAFVFSAILSSGSGELVEALPHYRERLLRLGGNIETLFGPGITDSFRQTLTTVNPAALIAGLAAQLAGAIYAVGLVALYLAFLMSERQKWVNKIPNLARAEEGRQRSDRILRRIAGSVKQYMWVNAVTSLLSATVAFVIFSLVGLDFASLLALIVFVVGFIPNIGAFIGIALPSIVALLQFETIWPFLIVLVGYGLSDQVISNVVQPMMQGRSLNLSTFMIMVSLVFWTILWGGMGAFLAIPLVVVVMIICAEIPEARWIAVLLSADGELEPPDESSP